MQVDYINTNGVSHTDTNIYCKPCHEDTKRVPANGLCRDCAEHMCIACFGNHKKYKLCKDHVLLDINAKVTGECDPRGDYEACSLHDCGDVKFYCAQHDQVGCGDCIILKHKTCDVKYIRDIAVAFKDSKDRDALVDKVQCCQREAELCSTSIRINNIQVTDIHNECISAIQSFRDEINENLDKLERVSVERASELNATDTTRMSVLEKECEDIAKELSQMNKVLETQADDPNKLFVSAMQYKRGINALEQKLRNINTRNNISVYSFKRDENMQRTFITCTQLGSVLHRTCWDSSRYSDYSDLEYMDSEDHYTVLDYTLPVTGTKQENSMHSSDLIEETTVHPSTSTQETMAHPSTCIREIANRNSTCIPEIANRHSTCIPEIANRHSTCIPEIANRNSTCKQSTAENPPTVRQNSIEHCATLKQETPVRLPVRASRKDKKRGKQWSLLENQQRCDNIVLAGEYMSFKDNEACAVGLYVGKKPIKSGSYFEVEILSTDSKGTIGIGFVPKDYPLDQVGVDRLSVGYHASDGCIYEQSKCGVRIGPPCGIGDRMGIGIASSITTVFQTKLDIFFTRNGKQVKRTMSQMQIRSAIAAASSNIRNIRKKMLGELTINSPSFCKVYPAIGMHSAGEKVRTIMNARAPRI